MRVSSGILKWKMKSRLWPAPFNCSAENYAYCDCCYTYVCVFFNKLLRVASSATFLIYLPYQVDGWWFVVDEYQMEYNCIRFCSVLGSWSLQYSIVCLLFLSVLPNYVLEFSLATNKNKSAENEATHHQQQAGCSPRQSESDRQTGQPRGRRRTIL